MNLKYLLFVSLFSVTFSGNGDIRLKDMKDVIEFLVRFGYLNPNYEELMNKKPPRTQSESIIFIALKEWQEYNGITPATGVLDDRTLQRMNDPRCANKDDGSDTRESIMQEHYPKRQKRSNLQGSKWNINDLMWKLSRYPPGLNGLAVLNSIIGAIKLWEAVTPLNFKFSPNATLAEIHIDIRFDSGCHGDGECHDFDGKIGPDGRFGNTLAHAFYPQWGGDVHFDEDEEWSVNSFTGCSVFIVAAHEIGHALGLNHSSVPGSLMQPIYPPYRPNHDLHDDDIIGIQTLYGSRKKSSDDASATKEQESNSTDVETRLYFLCVNPTVDDVGIVDGSLSIFKDNFYYKILKEGNGVQKGYPKFISGDFLGVGGQVDAVLTATRGRLFIFKGDKFWKFYNTEALFGYPKKISEAFKGIPSNIDAAFQMESRGKVSTYIFKGEDVWTFSDPDMYTPVEPEKISTLFPDLPTTGIDAIVQSPNKMVYAFKKTLYWRLNDSLAKSSANPEYPRETALWFLGCRVNSNSQ